MWRGTGSSSRLAHGVPALAALLLPLSACAHDRSAGGQPLPPRPEDGDQRDLRATCATGWDALIARCAAEVRGDMASIVDLCVADGVEGLACFDAVPDDCELPVLVLVALDCFRERRLERARRGGECDGILADLDAGRLVPDAEGRVTLTGERATLSADGHVRVDRAEDGRTFLSFAVGELFDTGLYVCASAPFLDRDFVVRPDGVWVRLDEGTPPRLVQRLDPRWARVVYEWRF